MQRRRALIDASAAASLALLSSVPAAWADAGATGVWNRDDGRGGVRIAHCGAALCGHVVWLRDRTGPAFIGQKVLFDMRPAAANTWSGTAHNPEDGQDYAGTMTLEGNRLVTKGCVLGGMICQTVGLTRSR